MLVNIAEAESARLLLLQHGSGKRAEGLMKAMDALNLRYGRDKVSSIILHVRSLLFNCKIAQAPHYCCRSWLGTQREGNQT